MFPLNNFQGIQHYGEVLHLVVTKMYSSQPNFLTLLFNCFADISGIEAVPQPQYPELIKGKWKSLTSYFQVERLSFYRRMYDGTLG